MRLHRSPSSHHPLDSQSPPYPCNFAWCVTRVTPRLRLGHGDSGAGHREKPVPETCGAWKELQRPVQVSPHPTPGPPRQHPTTPVPHNCGPCPQGDPGRRPAPDCPAHAGRRLCEFTGPCRVLGQLDPFGPPFSCSLRPCDLPSLTPDSSHQWLSLNPSLFSLCPWLSLG